MLDFPIAIYQLSPKTTESNMQILGLIMQKRPFYVCHKATFVRVISYKLIS